MAQVPASASPINRVEPSQARSGSSMRAAFIEGRARFVCGPVIRGPTLSSATWR